MYMKIFEIGDHWSIWNNSILEKTTK